MTLRPATWSAHRMRTLWAGGLVLEALLLLALSVVLVRPEPPLVARLRGDSALKSSVMFSVELRGGSSAKAAPTAVPPAAEEDSFYTVLHWPLDKPVTAGGGRVVAVPMRFWWVPVLYVSAVPLLLVGLTGAWLWARNTGPRDDLAA